MKKYFFPILFVFVLSASPAAHAQTMRGFSNSTEDWSAVVEHTAREEAEGKEVWAKLQAKELGCADLDEEQFGALGEYFMGQMMGDSHAAMNAMMIQMHGEEGEEQIHVVMGKRLSGCDTSAALPMGGGGWMPMMQGMWGGGNLGTHPMWWGGFGSWLVTILSFVWVVVGILAAVWLWKQIRKK